MASIWDTPQAAPTDPNDDSQPMLRRPMMGPPNPFAMVMQQPQGINPFAMNRSPASVPGMPPMTLQGQVAAAQAAGAANAMAGKPGARDIGTSKQSTGSSDTMTALQNYLYGAKDTNTSKTNEYDPEKLAEEEGTKQAAAESRPGFAGGQAINDELAGQYNRLLPAMISTNTSLKPAQAFIDQINHTDFSKDMAEPLTGFQMGGEAMKNLTALANRKQALLNEVGQAMGPISPTSENTNTTMSSHQEGNKTGDTTTNKTGTEADLTAGIATPKPISPTSDIGFNITKKINDDANKYLNPLQTSATELNKTGALLNLPSTSAQFLSGITTIRSEINRISGYEAQGILQGASGVKDQADQLFQRVDKEGWTPKNRADLIDVRNQMAGVLNSAANDKKKDLYDSGVTMSKGALTPDQLKGVVEGKYKAPTPVYNGETKLANPTPIQKDLRNNWLMEQMAAHPDNPANQGK